MGKLKPNTGTPKPDTQIDSHFSYEERDRENCYVQGEADLEYGQVSGFRAGITSTGHRHRASALGKKVR